LHPFQAVNRVGCGFRISEEGAPGVDARADEIQLVFERRFLRLGPVERDAQ
jgi:hypothetical protein